MNQAKSFAYKIIKNVIEDILLKPTNLFTHFDMIQTNLHIVLFVEEATKYVDMKLILPPSPPFIMNVCLSPRHWL